MKKQLAFLAFLALKSAVIFGQITAPTAFVCFDDCSDFLLPDSSSINCAPGLATYEIHFLTQNGADSVVVFPVMVFAPNHEPKYFDL